MNRETRDCYSLSVDCCYDRFPYAMQQEKVTVVGFFANISSLQCTKFTRVFRPSVSNKCVCIIIVRISINNFHAKINIYRYADVYRFA